MKMSKKKLCSIAVMMLTLGASQESSAINPEHNNAAIFGCYPDGNGFKVANFVTSSTINFGFVNNRTTCAKVISDLRKSGFALKSVVASNASDNSIVYTFIGF
ncbi:MAG: hypothetical protein PHR16_12305 [Methylovulum sp.]|nr:hypothetical protein [Methylovulum sp.]